MVNPGAAVVIGASGGIGGALVRAIAASGRYGRVHALSRHPAATTEGVTTGAIDLTDEASVAAAAQAIGSPFSLLLIATGVLHEAGRMPEKSLAQLDAIALARLFAVNTIGPALAIKHFAPLIPRREPAIIAVLSARVGSISDNRSGGWHGYRASKAALNMIIKCAAIELARTRPEAICVALHPGTVDTPLSEPFQRGVAAERLFTPKVSARHLLEVIAALTPAQSGRVFAWDGAEIAP